MKILIVTHYNFLAESSGSTNRVLELAKNISNYASIEILHQGPNMTSHNIKFTGYNPIIPFGRSHWILRALSPYISYFFPSFYKKMKEINEIDVVQIEQPYLFPSTLFCIRALNKKAILVLDEHNVDFSSIKSKIGGGLLNSFFSLATLPYIFLFEYFALKHADAILCVSEKDQNILSKFYRVSKSVVSVIPNGVNLVKFDDAPPIVDWRLENQDTIFFHGTLSWLPNLEAANIIINFLAPKLPNVTFLIAGSNPPLGVLKKIKKSSNVKYLGFVKNLEGWINSSNVCIAPLLRGGGTKLKMLEYAAAGKPIVGTFEAVQGLKMVNGTHGLFFKEVNGDFINGIKNVLNDKLLSKELSKNVLEYAKKFDWQLIGKKLQKKYSDVCK